VPHVIPNAGLPYFTDKANSSEDTPRSQWSIPAMRQSIIPCLRYENAPAAIEFLCTAFGFERHAVYADEADPGLVHHAQLTLGGTMIMLSTATVGGIAATYGWKTPKQAGGITMALYAIVPDPDAHHARALAAGATIAVPPRDNEGYPGRSYDAFDTEGHCWNFGSYDPWA
jgi:uncharacterized glyoxalase superfamily protein PhnB